MSILTGFRDLDDVLGELQAGELIVIAGRPAMGKTNFAISLLNNIGVERQIPCAILSLGTRKKLLTQKMMSSFAEIS